MNCCTSGLDEIFTNSRKEADRYRKHGLPRRAQLLVGAIEETGSVQGQRVLEIGVGAGAVTIELLRHGAGHATGVDAVAGQLTAARELAADVGVADRLELLLGDFTELHDIGPAEIVVLDRVVCCYPDWRTLLDKASRQSTRLLAMVYPRRVWYMRLVQKAINAWRKLLRTNFRFHLHPVDEMQQLLRSRGLQTRCITHYYGWEITVAVR